MAFPTSVSSFTDPSGTSLLTSPDHAGLHSSINVDVIAIENKLGISAGTPTANKLLAGSGNGTSTWTTTWNSGNLGTPTITGGLITGGSISSGIIGTSLITGGTINQAVMGSPTITGGALYNGVIGTSQITGGTASSITLGTPTILGGTISGSGTVTPISFGVSITPQYGTITDTAGGTFAVNAQAAQIYYSAQGTAAGNRTLSTPTNPTAGQPLTFAFKASGSANGTLVWGTAFRISQDAGTPTMGTGTSWNYFAWRYNGIDSKWDSMGNSKNLV